MAEELGSGLQNRVHQCESGSRLEIEGRSGFHTGEWWNGIHDRLKICWASAHEGSTPSSPKRFFDNVRVEESKRAAQGADSQPIGIEWNLK